MTLSPTEWIYTIHTSNTFLYSLLTQKLALVEESKALKQQMKLLKDKLCTTEAANAHLQEEVNVFSAVKNLINRSDSKT